MNYFKKISIHPTKFLCNLQELKVFSGIIRKLEKIQNNILTLCKTFDATDTKCIEIFASILENIYEEIYKAYFWHACKISRKSCKNFKKSQAISKTCKTCMQQQLGEKSEKIQGFVKKTNKITIQ